MNNKKVSAIVLTYNQQDTVGRTIESILAQKTSYDLEIIIGEDGSTDATRSICERYAAEHPDIIRLTPKAPNRGVTGNFVDCLEHATGDFFAVCAGDDWWCDEEKLQKQASFLDANPDYVVVHGEMKHYNVVSGRLSDPHIRKSTPEGDIYHDLLSRHIVNAPTACVRRSAITKEDTQEWISQHFLMEDLPMWLTLGPKGKFHYMPEYLTTYSVGAESICSSRNTERLMAFAREIIRVMKYYHRKNNPGFPESRLDKILHKKVMTIALESGDQTLIGEVSKEVGVCLALRRRLSRAFKQTFKKHKL